MTMATKGTSSPYRPVKPLSFELTQHIGIFFEEKLYTQALTLLFNILASGTSALNTAYIPSPPHFAVAATCLVHPRTTTRANSLEEKDAAAAALRLLRLTNTLFGPVGARLDAAFTFTHFQSSRHGFFRRRVSEDAGVSESRVSHFGDEMKPLNLDLGQSAALWSRAEDFWHAVGWALNCSVLHRERWEVWRLWLEFMCEVLEDDWTERLKMSEGSKSGAGNDDEFLKQSLIFRYVDQRSINFGRERRILRAIFADGSPTAISEFGQVFAKELESRVDDDTDGTARRKEPAVNIDAEQFGDYLSYDEEKETDSEDNNTDNKRVRKRPRRGTRGGTTPAATSKDTISSTPSAAMSLGGLTSLALRQRLLSLLSCVSNRLPDSFIPLDDLYHLFVENIRHLPLPVFQSFISPTTLSAFSQAQQITICDHLLCRMLESSAPNLSDGRLTQSKLEQCYLPFTANTTSPIDNAKVSITLEALLILLVGEGLVTVTPEFREAVERGIIARVDKAGSSESKKKGPRVQDIERCWLLESGDRLMFVVDEVLGGCSSG